MSATVGTRWHLMSSDDLSSLSNLVSTTCESSESASQTYNHFYNIPPIISVFKLQITIYFKAANVFTTSSHVRSVDEILNTSFVV